jgi:CRP-like cAMP-binding protein
MALYLMFKVPYFDSQSLDLLQYICEHLELKTFEEHQFLMMEGEIGDSMFVIVSGFVKILKVEGESLKQIVVLGPNQVVGETAIKESQPKPRSASAMANTRVEVLELTKRVFE